MTLNRLALLHTFPIQPVFHLVNFEVSSFLVILSENITDSINVLSTCNMYLQQNGVSFYKEQLEALTPLISAYLKSILTIEQI